MTETTRCGLIAIIGEPNAGKSTLINTLVGGKVSIVSPKVQTTRFNVRGVCARGDTQLVFIDTPGIFEAERTFEKAMVRAAWSGLGDADAGLLLIDARAGLREGAQGLLEKLGGGGKPLLVALNKVDTVDKTTLFELAKACSALAPAAAIYMISALKGDGVEDIAKELAGRMPQGPWLYPADQMSDIPMRLLAAEITREKAFLALEQELPYALSVETESWDESEKHAAIAQAIVVQREGQKKIVIGEKGSMVGRIGMASRRELEKMLGKKVHLQLFVKVRGGWKDDAESYRLPGMEYRKE